MLAPKHELEIYPGGLLEQPMADDPTRVWYVLYTRSRQEKRVARFLADHSVPFYMPLTRKVNQYKRRRLVTQVPVFSGYVFLFGTEEERVLSLTTNRLSRVLPVGDGDRLRHDLKRLQCLITSGAALTVESRIAPGQKIRVKRGPLKGLVGTVLVRRGETRLLIAVDFLQQGASIAIDDFLLEPTT